MKTQIQTLLRGGMPIRKIAIALNISRQSVRKYSIELTDQPKNEESIKGQSGWHSALPWDRIATLEREGVTVTQLHKEFAPSVSYWSFWRHLRLVAPQVATITMRVPHKPGERVEIDYADGIPLVDRETAVKTKTQFFCGVLPFSSFIYAEFSLSQQLASFIASQERMWAFFGGVTPYMVVDNLKSGVLRAHVYDPDVNAAYCEYANHMGFAVIPARPYKPRDKATIEANIGALQGSFFQEVRERTFYSLNELNEAFFIFLRVFNDGVMKDYGVSRNQRFATERPLLKAIPPTRHEPCEWMPAKVHNDCHVQVERNYYSVPFAHVGKTVRVRLTSKMVEVFTEARESIAVHARLVGIGQTSTNDQHYPEKKLSILRFDVHQARTDASRIGPETTALVEFLIHEEYPLKYLRRIQGILRLHSSGHVTVAALEHGCKEAMKHKRPRLQFIKDCAENFPASGARLRLVKPERAPDEVYLHQADEVVGGAS